MISHKHRCIFIHIPKCAGSSIETKLCQDQGLSILDPDHRALIDFEPFTVSKALALYQPRQIKSLMRRIRYFTRQKSYGSYYSPASSYAYHHYFKFAFVRTPWSRVYSWYKNVMRDINHQNVYKVPPDCSFSDFVKYHHHHPALRSQMHWLTDSSGEIAIDYIGKFHHLSRDFSKICKQLGIKNHDLPKKKYTGTSESYLDAYDPQSKKIIADRYAEEIEYFKFNFEDK